VQGKVRGLKLGEVSQWGASHLRIGRKSVLRFLRGGAQGIIKGGNQNGKKEVRKGRKIVSLIDKGMQGFQKRTKNVKSKGAEKHL